MLDAAYPPPSPDQLVADMDAAGADAAAVYVYGPIVRWTRSHVAAARARGKYLLPIVVPGDSPPAPVFTLAAAAALDFTSGPIALDLETNSRPPAAWVAGWARSAAAAGWRPRRYGTGGALADYPAMEGDWVAYWPRTGALRPTPALGDLVPALRQLRVPVPAGPILGWQYTDDVNLAHGQYDASVVVPALFAAAAPAPAAAAGEGTMLRIPGPTPDSWHLFGTAGGRLVRVSAVSGGLGAVEAWLSQPGNGWVDHGAPADLSLRPGTLGGGRGLDGNGAPRVEVHAQASDGRVWSYAIADDGSEVLAWQPLPSPALDAGAPGQPGPDVRPAVADALDAAAAQLRS